MSAVRSAAICVLAAAAGGVLFAGLPPDARLSLIKAGASGLRVVTGQADAHLEEEARPPQAAGLATPPSYGTVVLVPDRYGQYHTTLEVEGRQVPAMVDTGASWVSLSYETGHTLGFYPAPADFTIPMATANGVTHVAPVQIAELRVGPIVARHVQAMVLPPGALTTQTLLGMSFLRGLSGFFVDGGRLVLKQ